MKTIRTLTTLAASIIAFYAQAGETNYVYYAVKTGEVMAQASTYSYDIERGRLELGDRVYGGIDWSEMRLGMTTAKLSEKTVNVSQVAISTNVLPVAEADKGDWEKRFSREEKAIMAVIKKLISRMPVKDQPTDEEIKSIVRTELQKAP